MPIQAALRIDFEYRGKKYWDTSNVDVMDPVKLLSARASHQARRLGVRCLW